MHIMHAIILAIIEGITEFLPISSTGHMILASHLLKIPQTEFLKSFEIIIQLGAILAVVVLYFDRIKNNKHLWKIIAAAFIPSGVIGFIMYKLIKAYLLGNDTIVVASLIIGGFILLFVDRIAFSKDHDRTPIEDISITQAIQIGLGQALAIIPGVSRSASTIITAGLVKVDKNAAVEFSFLLAIPTMLAASVLDLSNTGASFSQNELLVLALGFFIAFITALVAVKYFVKFVQNNSFALFGWYRIVAGIVYWLLLKT